MVDPTKDPRSFQLNPVGVIRSCYKEKFGIPRQPGIAADARAEMRFYPPYDRPEAVEGLAGFSHVWILFVFHAVKRRQWKPTVRPPRLGGNQRVGVFATRSPYRPNPVGLSAVGLETIEFRKNHPILHLTGIDLMDGTPVIDIKPYVSWADALPDARGGFAHPPPRSTLRVVFSPAAREKCDRMAKAVPYLENLIIQTLQADPRPAYYGEERLDRRFGMRILDMDVKWIVDGDTATVLDLIRTPD